MKKEITKGEYLQLQGLFYIGREAAKKWEEYERAIENLMDIPENSGSIFGDALINGDKTVDEILKIEGVNIKK